MPALQRVGWGGVVVALVVSGAAVAVVRAQAKPSVDASMTQLVSEVRALRLSVERSLLVTARTQAMLGRVQLQENRLATLGRDLQESRVRVREAMIRQGQNTAETARLAAFMDDLPVGSDQRRDLERQLVARQREDKQHQAVLDQLRADDSEIAQALATEQSRWTEYNERLETLEQDLAIAARPQP